MPYTSLPSYTTPQTGNYTLTGYEDLVEFNAASGNIVATMCSASSVAGAKLFILKKTDSTTNTVTINPVLSQTFDYRSVITLRQEGDYVILKSDGSNWQIVSKKETEIMNGTASAATANTVANGTYFATSATLTLTPGTWRITGSVCFSSGTAGNGSYLSIQGNTGIYAATGTGTTTPPTALSGAFTGPTSLGFGAGEQAPGGTGSGPILDATLAPFTYTVTANTAIYMVAQVQYISGSAAGEVYTQVTAERVW